MGRKPIWPHTPLPSASRRVGILLPALTSALGALDVNASFWTGHTWYPACTSSVPSVMPFETAYGVETLRWAYNERCRRRVMRHGKTHVGEHAGFHDVFVPVAQGRDFWGMFVVGPLALARPSKGELLTRWGRLTGQNGQLGDPSFSAYVTMTLSAPTFAKQEFEVLKLYLERLAELLVGAGLERIEAEADVLLRKLDEVRFAERMWRSAAEMVDERTIRSWMSASLGDALAGIGLGRLPTHVVVGLLRGREESVDPIDDVLGRDAFQRACVAFAKSRGGVACRRIGEHGVALLVEDAGRRARTSTRHSELAQKLAALAKRFGLRLHAGSSRSDDTAPLTLRYQAALSAAEAALVGGERFVRATLGPAPSSPLLPLRRELVRSARENSRQVSALFDRYMEAAAARSGYRVELLRVHLETAFDEMCEATSSSGALDERSITELRSSTQKHAAEAETIQTLMLAYRPGVSTLESALGHPELARRDHGLRRTLDFIRDHLDEPLQLEKLARVAGYASRHLARLFVEVEQRTPKQYVDDLRVARAKHLLATTALSSEQIGKLTGLGNRASMHRTFSSAVGMTPGRYREKHSPASYEARELGFRQGRRDLSKVRVVSAPP
jgi:AraC-like DNA-binding protein